MGRTSHEFMLFMKTYQINPLKGMMILPVVQVILIYYYIRDSQPFLLDRALKDIIHNCLLYIIVFVRN